MDCENLALIYYQVLSDTKHDTRKMEFTKANNVEFKFEFPIYENQKNLKLLCKLVHFFNNTISSHN